MPKKPSITQEDIDIFHKAVEGTKPLTQRKVRLSPDVPVRKRTKPSPPPDEVFQFSDADRLPPIQGEDMMEYNQDGISHKTLRKLRKGQYNVEAKLDLHGMTTEKARIALNQFLMRCLHKKMRVVLVIHGKGHPGQAPILKNKLNHWLRETDVVLAFCSAASIHGNRGATYILLKRKTEEDFD
jgi:DNA-nicking Smr family endonuclease